MKGVQYSGMYFILLVIVQITICNLCPISPLLTISILPALILCMKTDMNPVSAMIVAFLTGLATDLLGDGVIGLNALALVPVAAVRPFFLSLFFGKETVERGEYFSFRKNGAGAILTAVICLYAVFLLIYIGADGAGTRSFLFNSKRFVLSMAASVTPALICVHILSYQERN